MIDGKKVGQEINAAHKEIYGHSGTKNNVFAGGNVGMSFLGLCIQEGARSISSSITALATAISNQKPPIIKNYYNYSTQNQPAKSKKKAKK